MEVRRAALSPWGTLCLIVGSGGIPVDNLSDPIASWTFSNGGQAECALWREATKPIDSSTSRATVRDVPGVADARRDDTEIKEEACEALS